MTEKLQKIIKEELAKLTKEAQEAINSVEWIKIAEEIGKKHLLTENEITDLQTETLLVLADLEDKDLFAINVENKVGTTKNEAMRIAEEAIEKIFNPIFEKIPVSEAGEQSQITETLDQRFDKMPEAIRKIIVESGYHGKLYAIATESKLNVPQMGALEEATTSVITGATHPDNFENKIKEKMTLPEETVKKLVIEINEKILKPIREKMEKEIQPPATPVAPARNAFSIADAGGPKAPIILPKLTDTVQSATVKTDYTVKNITKSADVNDPKKASVIDPYREAPE